LSLPCGHYWASRLSYSGRWVAFERSLPWTVRTRKSSRRNQFF